MKKLWGGRFTGATHGDVEAFTFSLNIDSRLWEADISGSQAHAKMLGEVGVLTAQEAETLVTGLERVRKRGLSPTSASEDVHSAIESALREEVGELAGKLHTARSRNDQVATATRLWLRSEIAGLTGEIRDLQTKLVQISENHVETLLPGLTHLQHAQPVSLAHHLMAYFWMLERDRERCQEIVKRVSTLPLGSAALAGTGFPIRRERVAELLGFEKISENSLDAVSDRDFVVEFLGAANLIMLHLSRFAEELVLWSTPEFAFVTLSDGVTTGSSIMPQKKNPDVAELIRGRVGRVSGALVGASIMLKALPLSYNRDLQEDKVHLFEGVDTTRSSVRLTSLMLSEATFHVERMAQAVTGDFSNATDIADFLAEKGVPFREAHEVVGGIVRHCLEKGYALESLALEDLKKFHPLFDDAAVRRLSPLAVLRARQSRGGTAPAAVLEQIRKAKALL